jgi:hypothetical protein
MEVDPEAKLFGGGSLKAKLCKLAAGLHFSFLHPGLKRRLPAGRFAGHSLENAHSLTRSFRAHSRPSGC